MNMTRIMVLGIAVGAAFLAAYLARGLMASKEPVTTVEVPKVEMTDVLVAARNIPIGDKLNPDRLEWAQWPSSARSERMITRAAEPNAMADLASAIARSAIFQGEPVTKQKLVLPGQGGFMAAILPEGMRAISVRISPESGAGGFILPGDRVDVILTRKIDSPTDTTGTQVSEPVLNNVRVLAIDQTFRENEGGEQVAVGKTATLELSPAQTRVLALAESSGQLTLALRSLADNHSDQGPETAREFGHGAAGMTIVRYGIGSPMSSSQ